MPPSMVKAATLIAGKGRKLDIPAAHRLPVNRISERVEAEDGKEEEEQEQEEITLDEETVEGDVSEEGSVDAGVELEETNTSEESSPKRSRHQQHRENHNGGLIPLRPSPPTTIPPVAEPSISTTSTSSNYSHRRAAHIASEQKRRQNINEGFEDLRRCVPTCTSPTDSKAVILRKAVNYIWQLQSEMLRLRGTTPSIGNGSPSLPPATNNNNYTSLPLASSNPSYASGSGGAVYGSAPNGINYSPSHPSPRFGTNEPPPTERGRHPPPELPPPPNYYHSHPSTIHYPQLPPLMMGPTHYHSAYRPPPSPQYGVYSGAPYPHGHNESPSLGRPPQLLPYPSPSQPHNTTNDMGKSLPPFANRRALPLQLSNTHQQTGNIHQPYYSSPHLSQQQQPSHHNQSRHSSLQMAVPVYSENDYNKDREGDGDDYASATSLSMLKETTTIMPPPSTESGPGQTCNVKTN